SWDKFTLEGALVRFSEPPPFGSKVEVKYKHGAEGAIEEAFELEKDAVEDGLVVTVDGKSLSPGEYVFNEAENRIEFKEPPPEKAKIEVKYKEEIELLNEFEIGTNVRSDSIKAYVDGKRVKGIT